MRESYPYLPLALALSLALSCVSCSTGSDADDWKRTYEPMLLSAPFGEVTVKRPSGEGWEEERMDDQVVYKKILTPSGGEARIGVVMYHSRGAKPTHRGLRRFVNPAYEIIDKGTYKGRKLVYTTLRMDTKKGEALSEGVLIFYDNKGTWILDIFFSEIGGAGSISAATRAHGLSFRASILEGLDH